MTFFSFVNSIVKTNHVKRKITSALKPLIAYLMLQNNVVLYGQLFRTITKYNFRVYEILSN